MLSRRLLRGELRVAVKNLDQIRKIVGTAFFKLLSSFYTSIGGGSEAPILRMVRWGLLLNRHRTSLAEKKSNFNTRVCFTITFTWFVWADAHLTVLEAG